MLIITGVDRLCKLFVVQIIALVVISVAIAFAVSRLLNVDDFVVPITVASSFSFVVGIVEGLVWRLVAKKCPDNLTTFFTAVSGFRMLLALATIFTFYLVCGNAKMLEFCIVFMAFYLVFLIHHSVFFSYVSNSHSKCDNDK